MNALFLIHRYPPALGGSERYVQEMARRLVADGHNATVYTSNVLEVEGLWQRSGQRLAPGTDDDAGVIVRRFQARVVPLHSAISWLLGRVPWAPIGLTMTPPGLFMPEMWRATRSKGGLDLVHASAYPSMMYLGAVAARRSNARLVLMPCTHPGVDGKKNRRQYFTTRRLVNLYRQADAVIALTERERQGLVLAGVPAERIHVTGAGADPQAAVGADGLRFRQRYGLAADAPIVTFIGHKTAGKGALDLLDACCQVLRDRSDLIFAVAGEPTSAFTQRYNALPQPIQGRILDVRLAEQEKQDLLAATLALVLPSQDDSFGIVLLEAWLHGKPVIGARAGGLAEVIEEGHNGLLVPFGDVSALAKAIAWLPDHPAEAVRMGRNGREKTLRCWTWDAVYGRVRAVYDQVASAGAPARW